MKRIIAEDISKALIDVQKGADIYELSDAKLYGDLGKLGLVTIVEAMQAPADGVKRQPYFGCITTKDGDKVIRNFKRITKK